MIARHHEQLPFDRVAVESAEGSEEYSTQEFLALPLHKRIRHLMQGNVRFFRQGEEVDRRHALHELRSASS